MFGIGAGEFVVILIVGLIVFGPSKLPELGRAIGKTLREFRKAQAALSATLNEPLESERQPAPAEKNSSAEKTLAAPAVTADDIINLAKERPIVKENHDEKSFNGNPDDVPANDGARLAGSGRGSNGTGEQSEPATNGAIHSRG